MEQKLERGRYSRQESDCIRNWSAIGYFHLDLDSVVYRAHAGDSILVIFEDIWLAGLYTPGKQRFDQ